MGQYSFHCAGKYRVQEYRSEAGVQEYGRGSTVYILQESVGGEQYRVQEYRSVAGVQE